MPPVHEKIIMDLLFELCTWHAFAKLRLHTETTVRDLENSMRHLGFALRRFKKVTCASYRTTELPSEEAARGRRNVALAAKKGVNGNEPPAREKDRGGKKLKEFNLSTYKLHALGDYVDAIRQFGTTDNYTSQVVR